VSGNQTEAQAHAPVSGSGNQVTVIGDRNEADSSPQVESSPPAETAGQSTTGEDGVGSGNQTDAGATAPVQASDNQVTVIGDGNRNQAAPDSAAPASTTSPGSETTNGETTSGKNGAGSGNQIKPSFRAPVSASDNQVTVIGDGNTTESNNPDEGDTESPVDGSDEESSEVSTPTGDTPADHSTGAGSQAAAAGQIAHAAPAAAVAIAGTLPQTGASTGLLLWTLLGLDALMLGFGLVTGGRDRFAGHLRGQGAAQEL
jgi:LPXTG-motif cell wall-anchored protein